MQPKTEVTSSRTRIPVQGMSCGSCVRHVRTAVENVTGIQAVEVNLAAAEVLVSYNPAYTQPAAVVDAIRTLGYRPGEPETLLP
jgi:copper chaperone CopZ